MKRTILLSTVILLLTLLLSAIQSFGAVTAYYELKLRSATTGQLVAGRNVDLYQNGSKVYDLSESMTAPGVYYHNSVAHGTYDVYVGGALYKSGISVIAGQAGINFSNAGQLSTEGHADSSVTGLKIATATIDSAHLSEQVKAYVANHGLGDDGTVSWNEISEAAKSQMTVLAGGTVTNLADDVTIMQNPDSTISVKNASLDSTKMKAEGIAYSNLDQESKLRIGNGLFGTFHSNMETAIYNELTEAAYGKLVGVTPDTFVNTNRIIGTSNIYLEMNPEYEMHYYLTTDTTTNPGLLYFESDSNIVIDGGLLHGHADDSGNYTEHVHGIQLRDCKNVKITNVTFRDWAGDAIYIAGGEDIEISGCTFYSNRFSDSPLVGRQCISIVNVEGMLDGKNYKIHDNTFYGGSYSCIDVEPNLPGTLEDIFIYNNSMTGTDSLKQLAGVVLSNDTLEVIKNVQILGNRIKKYKYGITTLGTGGVTGMIIKQNIISECRYYGLYCVYAAGVLFTDNEVYGCDKGVLLTYENSHVKIKNNEFHNNGDTAIHLAGSDGRQNTHITISNNDMYDNAQTRVYDTCIINWCNDAMAHNNHIYDSDSTGQKYGLTITNCDGVDVQYNFINGNTHGVYQSGNSNDTVGNNIIN